MISTSKLPAELEPSAAAVALRVTLNLRRPAAAGLALTSGQARDVQDLGLLSQMIGYRIKRSSPTAL